MWKIFFSFPLSPHFPFHPNVITSYDNVWASLAGSAVKNLPVMQKIHVRSLSQEDPPKKEIATHSSILA